MTKYLTRKLKGGPDDESYLEADVPVKKRDAVKKFVKDAVREDLQPK